MLKEQLITLGFTPNEAEVYINLNELGQSKAGEIIKKTGFHRNIVYEALEKLGERKLVAKTIRQGVAYFRVLDPHRLIDEIKIKESLAQEAIKKLSERYKAAQQEIEVFEGLEGIKAHRDRSLEELKTGDEIMILGGSRISNLALNEYWQNYHERRVKKGIKARLLWNADSRKYGEQRKKAGLVEVKYLPATMTTPAWWEIWADRVGVGTAEGEPVLLSIKNPRVAEGFRNYFDLLWGQKIKTFEGIEAAQQIFYNIVDDMHLGEEYYVLGANWGGKIYDEEMQEFFQKFHQYRQKKGIKVKLLFGPDAKDTVERFKDNYKKFAKVKFLPHGISPTMQINFYHNKVFMIVWEDMPIVFSIENQKMADNLKAYFDTLWEQGEEFKVG